MKFEIANPNPEYLIKSIAEQGYSLETALADLIDNSITAGAASIEILINMELEPFALYLADDGAGMYEDELRSSMEFPSSSLELDRKGTDLGRFGLGMKTASFSQTRSFTVLSRKKGDVKYSGRTWDVDYLAKKGEWHLIINSEEEINYLVESYKSISADYLAKIEDFDANTIVIWKGLYKYEKYLEVTSRKKALKQQLYEVTLDHLSLVFHRFIERKKSSLRIRVNNKLIPAFNPFLPSCEGVRKIESKRKSFKKDHLKMEGFVLPSRSIDEVKSGSTKWTTKNCSLTDMEGIYVYRADRIIIFGGWNGLIKKGPRLQLARLRVEVGNSVDHLLHLNVSKSKISIPYDLKIGFEQYVEELKIEAEREFYNRGIRRISGDIKQPHEQLFTRNASSKGTLLELNSDFPILKYLEDGMSVDQRAKFKILIRMVNTVVNKIRQTHEQVAFPCGDAEGPDSFKLEIQNVVQNFLNLGWSAEMIKKNFIQYLGYSEETLPENVLKLLRGNHGH
jgi:hypothetical protein